MTPEQYWMVLENLIGRDKLRVLIDAAREVAKSRMVTIQINDRFIGPYGVQGVMRFLAAEPTPYTTKRLKSAGRHLWMFDDDHLRALFSEICLALNQDTPLTALLKADHMIDGKALGKLSASKIKVIWNAIKDHPFRTKLIASKFAVWDGDWSSLEALWTFEQQLRRGRQVDKRSIDKYSNLACVNKTASTFSILLNQIARPYVEQLLNDTLPDFEVSNFNDLLRDAAHMLPGWTLTRRTFRTLPQLLQDCVIVMLHNNISCLKALESDLQLEECLSTVYREMLDSEPDQIEFKLERVKNVVPARDASPKRK